MVKIFCVNTKTSRTFPEGTTLLEMLPAFEQDFEHPYPILLQGSTMYVRA